MTRFLEVPHGIIDLRSVVCIQRGRWDQRQEDHEAEFFFAATDPKGPGLKVRTGRVFDDRGEWRECVTYARAVSLWKQALGEGP